MVYLAEPFPCPVCGKPSRTARQFAGWSPYLPYQPHEHELELACGHRVLVRVVEYVYENTNTEVRR
jgi:hypothetical protein